MNVLHSKVARFARCSSHVSSVASSGRSVGRSVSLSPCVCLAEADDHHRWRSDITNRSRYYSPCNKIAIAFRTGAAADAIGMKVERGFRGQKEFSFTQLMDNRFTVEIYKWPFSIIVTA